MQKNDKETLADKIAGILTSKPKSFDPEDDIDDTSAKILSETFDEVDEKEEEILSTFRKQNIDLLGDVDKKYAGQKTSRKSLQESEDESNEHSLEDEQQESDVEEEELDESTDKDQLSTVEDSEHDGSEEEEEETTEEEEDNQFDSSEEKEDNFKHMKDVNIPGQVKKGQCVRNQMDIWEHLLEMRIQIQKCLIPANKMPEKKYFNEIKKESGPELAQKAAETKTNVMNVLEKLLQLQTLLIKRYPETKNLEKIEETEEKKDDDEEIPSDTDEEKSEKDEELEEKPAKIRKLADFETELKKQFSSYKNYRNGVIQKWNDKTRIIKSGTTATHSVLNQIEHNLNDKDRLVKRTQLKRSQYKILNQNDEEEEQEHNVEIFDDDDFYHQLLRELIEVKSADLTDPVQLGRQWIQLQNLRSKMKRKIDTRATKGRKIRYTVHPKLVNFMAPIDENQWTDEAKNELYNSLFGKNAL